MASPEGANMPAEGWNELQTALEDIQWEVDTGIVEAFNGSDDEPPAGELDLSEYSPNLYYFEHASDPPDSRHLGGGA